jgi:uncharacterized protein YjbJ (UPF0337 family)
MALDDKVAHKAEELKGRAKQGVGEMTDDEQLQAEGATEEGTGKLKQAGDKLKDAAGKAKDAVTGD